jgi:hypothetical protein
MNEQILMKLAEMEKKRGFKQKLKDNAWTIGLGVGARAPSVGFAIDQQRRNIKKEKATGEKPKSLIERRPGVVSGAITAGVVSPLLRTVMRGSRGGNTSPAQLATEMIGGAASGALGGALIVDPLTRWGARKYYQHRDKEIDREIRNRMQGGPLQKTAAYGDTIKNLARRVEGAAQNKYLSAFRKHHNTPGVNKPLFNEANKRVIQQRNLARSASQFAQRNAKALTTGAIGLGAAGAAAGTMAAVRAIKNKQQGQEKTASYYAARELLGL